MRNEHKRGSEGSPRKPKVTLDATMRAAIISVALSALVMALGALAAYGPREALGVAIGGAIAVANLYIFARVGDAYTGRRGRTAPWALIAIVKVTILLGGIWLILKTGVVPPLALMAGYASLIVGITIGSLFGPQPPEDEEPGTKSTPGGDRPG